MIHLGDIIKHVIEVKNVEELNGMCIKLSTVLPSYCVAFRMCIATNCIWSFVYCVIILCLSLLPHVYCFTVCVTLPYVI
jgi:hypothetical protein